MPLRQAGYKYCPCGRNGKTASSVFSMFHRRQFLERIGCCSDEGPHLQKHGLCVVLVHCGKLVYCDFGHSRVGADSNSLSSSQKFAVGGVNICIMWFRTVSSFNILGKINILVNFGRSIVLVHSGTSIVLVCFGRSSSSTFRIFVGWCSSNNLSLLRILTCWRSSYSLSILRTPVCWRS